MSAKNRNIVSVDLACLEGIADMCGFAEDMLVSSAQISPVAIPFDEVPEVEELPEEGSEPETAIFSLDHVGITTALSILSPRERQVLAMKVGLGVWTMPHKSVEIADFFGLSVETVSSVLTRARNRLRAVPNIVDIINGEDTYDHGDRENSLQTS